MTTPPPDAIARATEAMFRELVQRPDQVPGDLVRAIILAYLAALSEPAQ